MDQIRKGQKLPPGRGWAAPMGPRGRQQASGQAQTACNKSRCPCKAKQAALPHLAGGTVATQHAAARCCQPSGGPQRRELDAALHASLLLGCCCGRHGRRRRLLLVAPPRRSALVLCSIPAQPALHGCMNTERPESLSTAAPLLWPRGLGCAQVNHAQTARRSQHGPLYPSSTATHLAVWAALQRRPAAKQRGWVGGRGHLGGRGHREAEGVCRRRVSGG